MPHSSLPADTDHAALPGRVVLVPPPSFALLALAGALSALVLGGFLTLHRYTERTHAGGVLATERKLVPLTAPGQGQVAQRLVRDGQTVKAGDVLFVVTDAPTATTPAPQNTAQAAAAEKLARLMADGGKLDKQLSAQQEKLSAVRNEAQRLRKSLGQNALSDPVLMQKMEVVLEERSRLQSLEQAHARLQKSIAAARVEADAERQAQAAPAPAPAPAQRLVQAPFDGTVTGTPAEPGMTIQNRTLLTLAPLQGPLEAQLYLSAAQAALIQPGQTVQLRYPAHTPNRQAGTVLDVSAKPVPRAELPQALAARFSTEVSVHRVRVSLASDARATGAASGTEVEADIVRGSRPLIDWATSVHTSMKGSTP